MGGFFECCLVVRLGGEFLGFGASGTASKSEKKSMYELDSNRHNDDDQG